MQSIYKIVIALGGIFAFLLFLLFVLNTKFWIQKPSGGGVITSKNIDIQYWGTKFPEEIMNELLADYKAVNPNINIQYFRKSYPTVSEYRDYVADVLRTGNDPDILSVHSTWLTNINSRLSTTSDLFTEQQFKDEFYNVFKSSCYTKDNRIRCIPITYEGLVLVYNKGMFQDAGLIAPVTWEDVRDAAIRLTVKDDNGKISVGGVALGTVNNIQNAPDIMALMLAQSDVKLPDTLDSEPTVRTLNYYANFSKIDRVWDENLPEAVTAFATERAAMVLVNSSQMSEILRLNPTINIGVTKAPQLPLSGGTTTSKYISSSWVETVSANSSSEVQRASWEFLKWLSEPEQQIKLFQLMDDKAGINVVYANKTIKDQQLNSPLLGPFAKSADDSFTTSLTYDSGNRELIETFLSILTDDQNRGLRGDYEELKRVKDKLNAILIKGY